MRPDSHVETRITANLQRFAAACAALIATVGLLVLLGWGTGIAPINHMLTKIVLMRPTTAIGFLLAGVALWLLRSRTDRPIWQRRLGALCAALLALLGILGYAAPSLLLDTLRIGAQVQAEASLDPAQTALIPALCMLLLGLALLTIDVRSAALSLIPIAMLLFIIGLALTGYAYGVDALSLMSADGSMTPHTAALFLIAGLGLLAARPERMPISILIRSYIGSSIARRLLPAAIILPLALGWVRLQGQRLGWYGTEFGLALFVVSNITVFVGLIIYHAWQTNRTDARRESIYNELRESEKRIRLLVNATPTGLLMAAGDGRIVLANQQAEALFGSGPGGLIGHTIESLVPPRYRHQHPGHRQMFMANPQARQMGTGRDLFGLRRDGVEFPIEIGLNPIETAEGKMTFASIVDITERKRIEAQITASLHEKEILLKEIHHRVKNNLQVISSLLRLQSEAIADPSVRELFIDSQRRVRSMALVHEQLYQSHNLAQVNLRDYVNNLVNYLRRSYAQMLTQIEMRVTVESIALSIDRAMPLGLIINELVSNALKHAFPANAAERSGEIWVSVQRQPDSLVQQAGAAQEQEGSDSGFILVVGDTGVGLPEGLDLELTQSMGLQLVQSFTLQLRGRLTVQRNPGTIITVTIPASPESWEGRSTNAESTDRHR
jgi:two-component system, sensor histidine kinase PdtaS